MFVYLQNITTSIYLILLILHSRLCWKINSIKKMNNMHPQCVISVRIFHNPFIHCIIGLHSCSVCHSKEVIVRFM